MSARSAMELSSDTEATTVRRTKRRISSDTESECVDTRTSCRSTRKRKNRVKKSPTPEPAPESGNKLQQEAATMEEPTTAKRLKAKADKAFKAILNSVTSPENGISGAVVQNIVDKVTKLHALLGESLLHSSNLEGCIEALRSENKDQRRTLETVQEKAVRSQPPATQTAARPLTYAERVGVKSRVAAIATRREDPANVVTITPKDATKFEDSLKTKEAVLKLVSPKADKLQIKNIRRIQGSGIIVETAKKGDVAALMANEKLRAAGLVVGAPAKRSPRIIIYDVPRFDKDEGILDAVAEQNLGKEEATLWKKQAKLVFKTGDKKKDRCHCVFDVSKEARELIIRKEKLYIGWSCCRVQDYIHVTRCYKCQSYGHAAKFCKAEKDICGHCAAPGHNFKTCPKKEKPATCANCAKNKKASNHLVTSKDCPSYAAAVNQSLARTDYGY